MKQIFQRISYAVTLSSGWRRSAIAMLAGAVGALALAPVNFYPALVIPMTVAVWLIDGASQGGDASARSLSFPSKGAALDGWWMGFGYFIGGLWWLGSAFFIEADKFGVLAPFAVIGLPAVLAAFFSAGFFLASRLWSQGPQRIAALAAGLGAAEWLRSVAFTGFPWNNLGLAITADPYLSQSASIVGLHGLTLLSIFAFAAPAILADATLRAKYRALFLPIAALAGMYGFGAFRLAGAQTSFEPDVRFRIVQANVAQGAKFRPEAMVPILQKHIAMSSVGNGDVGSSFEQVSHFVWPESPFPVPLLSHPSHLSLLGSFLPPSSVLLTGAIRMESSERGRPSFYNSIHVISSSGDVIGNYDKRDLVPFGEYLPLGAFLEKIGLRQFVHVPGGFTAAQDRSLLRVAGLPPVAALICYEAIFPSATRNESGQRPGLILNVTNDAWFGLTPGPYQHFSQAKVRAIEEGLPLIRAANSGISAIVDPYGRVVRSLALGVEGVLDGPLPTALPQTIFARYPNSGSGLLLFLMFGLAVFAKWRP
jgi:apolipoprotein N-acyltransferase